MGQCSECIQKQSKKDIPVASAITETTKQQTKEATLTVIKRPKDSKSFDHSSTGNDGFEMRLLREINTLRSQPQIYIDKLEKTKTQCKIENDKTIYYSKDGNKYLVKGGIDSIEETISLLKSTNPLNKLIWSEDLKIDYFDSKSFTTGHTEVELIKSIERKMKQLKPKYENVNFIIDYFEDPELIVFLSLTEIRCNFYKRNILLNSSLTYYAVCWSKIPDRLFTAVSVFA